MTIDPSLQPMHLEVQRLNDEADHRLATLAPFTERVGSVLDLIDRLYHERGEAETEVLRSQLGYDRLLQACFAMVGHATVAADHSMGAVTPAWYDALCEVRRARTLAATA